MQYIRPFKNPEPVNVSPVRESRSLRIDDIPGAKSKAVAVTKNILHYQNRLSHDKSRYQENMQNHQFFNNHEYIFGGELKVGLQSKLPHGKRHYGDHYRSEISETGGIKRGDPTETHLQAFDYPRNLNIADIPGTLSGSAKPKSLINHDLAQRVRRGASVQRERPEDIAAPRRLVGDSLDRFQQEQVSNIRERRGSRNEDNDRKGYSITQETSGLEAGKKEQPHQHPREHGSEGNIKQVFNSSMLYRNAAGHPTRKGDMSFDNISRRKMSSQDYTVSYDRNQIGTLSERKDETPTRTEDNQYGSAAFRDNSRATTVNEIMTGGNRKPTEPQRQVDSKGWKESVLEQAYGKIMNKKDEFKKVYTYNIISNQPNQKMLPSNARLPYRYAIPFDVDHLTSNKRDITEQQNQAEMKRAYNLVLQHNNNIGREYNQSVSEHDYQ